MKVSIELDGTLDQIRDFLAAGIFRISPSGNHRAMAEAHDHLETAVKEGGITILLGEVTPERKLQTAGCI